MSAVTFKRQKIIFHTVTSAEETANAAEIAVKSGATSDDFAFIGQVRRDGVDIPGFDWNYSSGTGILEVADAGSADLTADDLISIIGTFTQTSE